MTGLRNVCSMILQFIINHSAYDQMMPHFAYKNIIMNNNFRNIAVGTLCCKGSALRHALLSVYDEEKYHFCSSPVSYSYFNQFILRSDYWSTVTSHKT